VTLRDGFPLKWSGGSVFVWGSRAAFSLLDQLAVSGCHFLLGIALARSLPQETFGAAALALTVSQIAQDIHGSVILNPLINLVSSEFATVRVEYLKTLWSFHWIVSLVCGALVGVAGLAATGNLRTALMTGALVVPVLLTLQMTRRIPYIDGDARRSAVRGTLYAAVTLLAMAALLSCGITSANLGYLAMAVGSVAAFTLSGQLSTMSVAPGTIALRQVARAHLRQAKFLMPATLLNLLVFYSPTFAVSGILGLKENALLRSAQTVSMPLGQLILSLHVLFIPKLAKDYSVDQRRFRRNAGLLLGSVSAAALFSAVMITLFGGMLYRVIFPPSFQPFSYVAVWLSWAVVATSLYTTAHAVLSVCRKFPASLAMAVATALVTLVCVTPLIKSFGLQGVALVMVVAQVSGLCTAALVVASTRGDGAKIAGPAEVTS
jgi:O-antigen/teichoic acid export membrane protein